jgi:hypothetical protein
MQVVTISLRRAARNAASINADALAQKMMAADDVVRVEHARVVAETFRMHAVLFLLAPTYGEAHAAALRICRRVLESPDFTGWAVEDHSA